MHRLRVFQSVTQSFLKTENARLQGVTGDDFSITLIVKNGHRWVFVNLCWCLEINKLVIFCRSVFTDQAFSIVRHFFLIPSNFASRLFNTDPIWRLKWHWTLQNVYRLSCCWNTYSRGRKVLYRVVEKTFVLWYNVKNCSFSMLSKNQ